MTIRRGVRSNTIPQKRKTPPRNRARFRGGVGEKAKRRLDGFLQFLGSAEGNLLAGLDVDGFASGRVAAHASSALANLEDTKADDADALALLKVLGDLGDEVGQNRFSGLLRQLVFFCQSGGKVLERHGSWGSCFLRHDDPPRGTFGF